MAITLCFYLVFTIAILLFAPILTEWMAQNPDTITATVHYIRLEMIGTTLYAMVKFLNIIFILLDMKKDI